MPLHDWTDRDNFDGLHHLWISEVVSDLRYSLPPPYRVVLGTSPLLALGGTLRKPDVGVTNGRHSESPSAGGAVREPDTEVTVATLEEDLTAQVVRAGSSP